MMKLKNIQDVNAFLEAVHKCEGDVIIRRETAVGQEEYNLKSMIAQILGVAQLLGKDGENYELFCMNKRDEPNLLQYFHEKYQEELANAEA